MAKHKNSAETSSTSTASEATTTRKKRTPAAKTPEILKLEQELEGAKIKAKELTKLHDGTKVAKFLRSLTYAGKARVREIIGDDMRERPTDEAFHQET